MYILFFVVLLEGTVEAECILNTILCICFPLKQNNQPDKKKVKKHLCFEMT